MKPASNRKAFRRGLWPFLAMFLLSSLLMPGCATQNSQTAAPGQRANAKTPYQLPRDAKVALVAGQRDLKISYMESRNERHESPERKSATVELSKHIPEGIVKCTIGGLLVALPLCALVMPIMLPSIGLAVDAAATAKEAAQNLSKQDTEKHKSAEELAKERKAAEEKLVAIQDVISKHLTGTDTTLEPQRPLVVRVQSYARESGVSDVVDVANLGPQSVDNDPGDSPNADYVFELSITSLELVPTAYVDTYWFSLRAQGRLLRTADKAVVDTFATRAATSTKSFGAWTAENGKQLSVALDTARDDLAKTFVDGWIKPALIGPH